MTTTCPHGLEFGRSHLDGVVWAGGVAFCRCHRASFGYIDSGFWSAEGSRLISADKDLCPGCGGKTTEMLTGSGEYDFMPGDEERWYRRTWFTDEEGHVHDEVAPREERP